MGRCQDKYFLRLDGGQNISCAEAHKTKMLQQPNNPFSDMPYVKIRMAPQECFLGNQLTAYSPGNLLYSSNIPQLTVPRLTKKWLQENSDGQGSKSELRFWTAFGIQTSEQLCENVKLILFVWPSNSLECQTFTTEDWFPGTLGTQPRNCAHSVPHLKRSI